MAKTQLELDIEQRELDAQKAAAAKEKRDAESAERDRVWRRNEFRKTTQPLVEWAGAEYTGDESLKFAFKGEVYSLSVDTYWSEGDNESGIPSGYSSAWYLHGRCKEVYVPDVRAILNLTATASILATLMVRSKNIIESDQRDR